MMGIQEIIGDKRDAILALAARYGASNVRIFGSVAEGEAAMKDDRLYLIHIGECIDRVESYTQGTTKEAFLVSPMVQDVAIRNLQTLAESTQRLSVRTKEGRPGIDWRKTAGFRHIFVHDYLGIDPEKVWNIVRNDLPVLKSAIQELLGPTS